MRMTQALTTCPPSQRLPFTRLQASVCSGYRARVTARRIAEYHPHLSVTPSSSLPAHSRLLPAGPATRKEHHECLDTLEVTVAAFVPFVWTSQLFGGQPEPGESFVLSNC
jgi:hypothetical protein